jgi:L-threonylcarbamoyladenylate synthase
MLKQTITLKVNRERPEFDKIGVAAEVIRRGGLVAFPTETVYGLGADALNGRAIARIYAAKKRPLDNPIIVHVSNKEEVCKLSISVPETANILMDNFWPGPLTLVVKASETVPEATRAGLDTVAVRMPSHKVALALIRESKVPIAAPSANLAGRPSPTTAEHVRQDLCGRIDLILDAGPTTIGVESTVLDLTADPPQVLRPGGVTYEELRRILGRVELHPVAIGEKSAPVVQVRSPGTKHRHYAPNAQVIVVEGRSDAVVSKVQELAGRFSGKGAKVGILATDESASVYRAGVVKSLGSRKDLATTARNLFRLLREFDMERVDVIVAEGVATKGLGLAVMNRLRKASGFNIVKAD